MVSVCLRKALALAIIAADTRGHLRLMRLKALGTLWTDFFTDPILRRR